jgi:DNA-binding Lrp family transcriptional regulator
MYDILMFGSSGDAQAGQGGPAPVGEAWEPLGDPLFVLTRLRRFRAGGAGAPEGAGRCAMEAFIFVKAAAGSTPAVQAALRQLPAMKRVNACWGVPDIIALVEVKDLQALRDLVLTQVQAVEGVTETDTRIVIE